MTRQSPPIVPERGVPLTAETVGLMQPGDWLRFDDGNIHAFKKVSPFKDGQHVLMCEGRVHTYDRFTFLGRSDADGWIVHDGGENPAPGLRVDVRQQGYSGIGENYLSDTRPWMRWMADGRIIAWRPHVASAPSLSTAETVVVPVEPTEDMMLAGALVGPDTNNGQFGFDDALTVYRAMLSAAPAREPLPRGLGAGRGAEPWSWLTAYVAGDGDPADREYNCDDMTAAWRAGLAALTPKEAPAEDEARRKLIQCIDQWDSEMEYDAEDRASLADDILHAFNGPPVVSEDAPAATGAVRCEEWTALELKPNDIAAILEENADTDETGLLNASQLAEKIYRAGRAQPQAREEAQPLDLHAIAKDASERVHKNGGCVPQMAFAPILFALQDALYTTPPSQPLAEGADAEKLRGNGE